MSETTSGPYAQVRKHKWVLIAGAAVLLFIIGQITGVGDDDEPVAGTTTVTDSEAVVVAVPDVGGMSLPDAIEALEDVGLSGEASDANEDRRIFMRSNWSVVDQDPAAGQEVEAGSTIDLGVVNARDDVDDDAPAAEPVDVTVPDVSGTNLAEADRKLRAAGLVTLPQDVHPDHDGRNVFRPKNWYALAQCPAPGETATDGHLILVAVVKVEELTPEIRAAGTQLQDEITC